MNKKIGGMKVVIIAQLLCCLVAFANKNVNAQNKSKTSQSSQSNRATTADQILKLGLFYYNNDDISDQAVTQFRAVITKYPTSNEAEKAQYYLGSYYHRKYYVQVAQYRKEDTKALDFAIREYRTYTDKFYRRGSHEWLADAFFNLALVYLQKGDARNAGFELNKMSGASSLDNSVYIYQVVYSQKYEDVIDGKVTTERLAKYTSSLIFDSNKSFEQIIAAIKDWFRKGSKA